jgi:hypothetical protein
MISVLAFLFFFPFLFSTVVVRIRMGEHVAPLRLLRLRFVRRPPTRVALASPFTVAITLTDDLGSPFFDYSSLKRMSSPT